MPTFPLVRGRTMRVTRLGGCCDPLVGEDNSVVTEGFVSVALTANITDPEEITVTNANGQTCVRDPGCAEFNGYGVELTFCDVNPCLFSLVTGQPVVLDAAGEPVGFRMNSDVVVCDQGFSLEVWMGVPGVACEAGEGGSFGYLLLPCLQSGVIGDFTIENAAVTFTVTGASTKDGNGWGDGAYADAMLADPLDPNDHLLVMFTTVRPPDPTDGCVAYAEPVVGAAATITTIVPDTGLAAGGTSVVITGTNFGPATGVTFDGVAGTPFTVDSPTQITVTTPAGTVGPVDVVVLSPDGNGTSVDGFDYT
ncbi:MAG TPA: IPT/TIG domain-containing protein [Acidimicrobiales bacterium]